MSIVKTFLLGIATPKQPNYIQLDHNQTQASQKHPRATLRAGATTGSYQDDTWNDSGTIPGRHRDDTPLRTFP